MDAATVEVVRSYLHSAAEEMRRTLVRTAFNPVIYEVLDFGISIYDRNLELVAEAPTLASFLGANDDAIVKGIDYIGRGNLEPGDIVLMNYPYWSAAHTLDVMLFAPVFVPEFENGRTPYAFTCIRAHWMDLGAKDPGYVLDSTDMHQEGLVFPGTKVYKRGEPDPEILELIRFNSRMPELVIGDLNAQVAATRTGERRLQEIVAKFGADAVDTAVDRVQTHGEALARRALQTLPRGRFEAEDWLDDDGISDQPLLMRVAVTIDEDRFHVDFTGSASSPPGPVTLPFGRTLAMCRIAFKALTTPHVPSSAGQFRPLDVVAPPGTLFHAAYPDSTFTLWTAIVALELVFKAVATAAPETMAACSGGDVPGFMMVGRHPGTGKLYAVSNNDPVGWGATATHDGMNATNHLNHSIVRNTPVEVLESKTAMRVERLELREDSGGAGRFRGGLGIDRHLRFVSNGELLSVMKKSKTPPWPLRGGEAAEPSAMHLFPGTQRSRRVGTFRAGVAAGDEAINRTAGGAGHGEPWTREPSRVLGDVTDGYVSERAAREIYGVVIVDDTVNDAETASCRLATERRAHVGKTARLTENDLE